MIPNSSGPQKVKLYFLTLAIIHFALLVGQLLFGALAYYLYTMGDMASGNGELNQMFLVVVPLVGIGGIIGGTFFSKKQFEGLRQKESLAEKLTGYQTTLIIKFALLEGPSFLAIVAYLLTGTTIYMAISAIIILLFIINRPSVTKVITDLELSQAEREIVENPEAEWSE